VVGTKPGKGLEVSVRLRADAGPKNIGAEGGKYGTRRNVRRVRKKSCNTRLGGQERGGC